MVSEVEPYCLPKTFVLSLQRMPKLSLDIEFNFDFLLVGISCHEKDYRICWAINQELGTELEKRDDLEIKEKKQMDVSRHSLFTWNDEENYIEYSVIANRSTHGLLLPEQKQADYLMKVSGNLTAKQKENILSGLRKISIVLTAFEISPANLKSKQNLVF